MAEIFIPEKDRSKDVLLEERILAELGVDGYERKRNSLTGSTEIHAPDGMGFEIGGEFLLDSNQNDIAVWHCPVPSTAMQQRRGSGWESYGDDSADYEPTIDTFVGTRLSLSIKHPRNRTIRNGDGWSSYFTKEWYDKDSDSDRPVVTLHVAGEVQAWYEAGLMPYMWQKGTGVMDWQLEMPDIPNGLMYWKIPVAEGDHMHTTLRVVPHEPGSNGLDVVERHERDDELWLPETGWSDAMFYKPSMVLANYNVWRGRLLDEPVPEDEYDDFMRLMRANGRAMQRDPLKNVTILEGEQYSPNQLDLDEAVEIAIRKGQKPLTYQEAQEQDRRLHNEMLWRAQEKRLRTQIAPMAGNISLHQLVRENTGDWMQEQREAILNREGSW